jgi:hypothetical protein
MGVAMPLGGNINVYGGAGITTTGSGDTITIIATGSGYTWNTVDSSDNTVQIVVENGYICTGSSQVVFLLPLTANAGDSFRILSYTSTFQITQNGGQQMRLGLQTTTPGSGNVTSNSAGDTVEMIYVGGNTFMAMSPQGTLTTV